MKYIYSILFLLLIVGCNTQSELVNMLPTSNIVLQSPSGERFEIMAEIATSSEELAQGLMNRKELKEGTGMMFVFKEEGNRSFWMKNTIIPLDIIFFDGKGEFVSYESMEPCFLEPCKHYFPAKNIKYALEINIGEASEMGVGEGWKLGNAKIK